MLSRLKVRTKLLTILLPCLLAIGVLSTLGVMDRLDQRGQAQRSVQLVGTARSSAALVDDLQTERLLFMALQNGYAPAAPLVDKAKLVTDADIVRVRNQLNSLRGVDGSIGGDSAAQVATAMGQQLSAVTDARAVYNPRLGSPTSISDAYTGIIGSLTSAQSDLMLASTDQDGTGLSLHWLSALKESDARSAADVTTIIASTQGDRLADATFVIAEVKGLQNDSSNATKVFTTDATETGHRVLDRILKTPSFVASQAPYASLASIDPAVGMQESTASWLATAQGRLQAIRRGESTIFDRELAAATTRASDLERQVRLYLGGSATALLLALLLATSVTRAITTSLGRLTRAARIISTEQLPKLVESLQHPDADHTFQITNIDLRSEDEFSELAAAFNAVEQTALDVAAEQVATLRKGISELFVNLARRNQSLLDRQIEFIDRLEANEEDPDQLENLFKLDHLATRMRRNAESLLVLAGAEAPRRRTKEVSLTDVIRVAVGEVEDFSRITLLAVDEANLIGSAAVDVAHLLSELMENGTQYSPPDRRVEVVGHRTNDGGYVVSVSDQGVGIGPDVLAEANKLLAKPPAVGLSLSRSLGFVVIATLAHRHHITVRLTDAPSGGIAALVTLPPTLLVHADAPVTAVHPEPARSHTGVDLGMPLAATSPLGSPNGLPDLDLGDLSLPSTSPFAHHRADDTAVDPVDDTPPAELDVPVDDVAPRWTSEPASHDDHQPVFALDDDPFAGFEPVDAPTHASEPQTESAFDASAFEPPFLDERPASHDAPAFHEAPSFQEAPAFHEPPFEAPAPPPMPPFARPMDVPPVEHAESLAPATSMADALPMGLAFEQGLFALLDHPDARRAEPPAAPVPPFAPPTAAPPAGPFGEPVPLADGMHPLLPDPAPEAIADVEPPAPVAAPALPQRRPTAAAGAASAPSMSNAERIGSPSRPPEEIRNILSRYRSGLQTGRSEPAASDGEPTSPDHE